MSRPKKCVICTGDPVIAGQVNGLLESGVKLKVVARELSQFSVSQLSRHRNRCLAKPASDLPSDAASGEIRCWLRRAEECYLTAQALGDSKAAISACSMAVRGMHQLARQLEREREMKKSVGRPGETPLTIESLDALVEQFVANDEKATHCRFCGSPRVLPEQEPHVTNASPN